MCIQCGEAGPCPLTPTNALLHLIVSLITSTMIPCIRVRLQRVIVAVREWDSRHTNRQVEKHSNDNMYFDYDNTGVLSSAKLFIMLPLDTVSLVFVGLSSNQSSQKSMKKAIKGPMQKIFHAESSDRIAPSQNRYPNTPSSNSDDNTNLAHYDGSPPIMSSSN
jgi:hypothetical protein